MKEQVSDDYVYLFYLFIYFWLLWLEHQREMTQEFFLKFKKKKDDDDDAG